MSHLRPLLLSAVLLLLFAEGCSQKRIRMNAAPIVPAATGNIELGRDENGNTQIEIKANNLAMPSRLTPPKNAYVVWIERSGRPAENQGVLRVGDDLKGEFRTVTPYSNFSVFVTAEENARAMSPLGEKVLQASVQP